MPTRKPDEDRGEALAVLAIFVAFCAWWMTSTAFGQAVRIVTKPQGWTGSGSLIGHGPDSSFYLTCAHVIPEGGQTIVTLPGGQQVAATVVARDQADDLALLASGRVPDEPASVAEPGPLSGPLRAYGFGGSGAYRGVEGRITGYSQANGGTSPSVRLAGTVRSGDSGGPVVNARGLQVGVLWGTEGGETYAMVGGPFDRIVSRMVELAGGNCYRNSRGQWVCPSSPGCYRNTTPAPAPKPLAPVVRTPALEWLLPYRDATNKRLDAIEQGLAGLNQRLDRIPPPPAPPDLSPINEQLASAATRAEIDATASKLEAQIGEAQAQANQERGTLFERLSAKVEALQGAVAGVSDRVARIKPAAGLAIDAWSAFAVGGPIGLGLAAWGYFRRRRGEGGPRGPGFPGGATEYRYQ